MTNPPSCEKASRYAGFMNHRESPSEAAPRNEIVPAASSASLSRVMALSPRYFGAKSASWPTILYIMAALKR